MILHENLLVWEGVLKLAQAILDLASLFYPALKRHAIAADHLIISQMFSFFFFHSIVSVRRLSPAS